MKRRVILALLLVASLMLVQIGFASPQGKKNIPVKETKYQEITAQDVLAAKARNGEGVKNNVITSSATLKNVETNQVLPVPAYSYTQLLKEETYADGTVKEYYTTFIFADVDDEVVEGVGILSESGNNYKEKWDGSYGVRLSNRIYYTFTMHNGDKFVDLTKFENQWYVSDSQLFVSDRKIRHAQKGFDINRISRNGQVRDIYPSSDAFTTYSKPGSWVQVNTEYFHAVGIYVESYVNRKVTGAKWLLDLENKLTSSSPI